MKVQGVLTLMRGGVAQTSHDDRVVELKEQLGIEEKETEKGKKDHKRKKGEIESKRTRHGWHGDDNVIAQNLSHEVCGVIIKCGTVGSMCRLHARSAPCNRRSPRRHWCTCLCVSFQLLWWCCGSSHTCSSTFHRGLCFRRSHSVYRCCCVGFGSHLSPLSTIEDVRYYGAMKTSKTFLIRFITSWLGRIYFQLQTRDSDMMDLELGLLRFNQLHIVHLEDSNTWIFSGHHCFGSVFKKTDIVRSKWVLSNSLEKKPN